MTKKQIIIFSIIIILIAIVPFAFNFAKIGISNNTGDWANFATYMNGILMPIFTIANLIILSNVNSSVRELKNGTDLYNKIKQQSEKGDFAEFRVDLEEQHTVEESLAGLEEKLKNIKHFLNDYATLIEKKDFETSQLGVPNTITRLELQIAQLKVNIYKELCDSSGNPEHKKKYEKLSKELQKLHKNSYLVD